MTLTLIVSPWQIVTHLNRWQTSHVLVWNNSAVLLFWGLWNHEPQYRPACELDPFNHREVIRERSVIADWRGLSRQRRGQKARGSERMWGWVRRRSSRWWMAGGDGGVVANKAKAGRKGRKCRDAEEVKVIINEISRSESSVFATQAPVTRVVIQPTVPPIS